MKLDLPNVILILLHLAKPGQTSLNCTVKYKIIKTLVLKKMDLDLAIVIRNFTKKIFTKKYLLRKLGSFERKSPQSVSSDYPVFP